MTAQIGFLGTGLMGAPMASRLAAAGFSVRVWNRSPEKAERLIAAGCEAANSPAAAVAEAEIVCLCLTDSAAIEALLFGPSGMAASLRDDAIIVDFSTIGPVATRSLASRLSEINPHVRWVDAPVSGGVKGAETGELVVFCGGEASRLPQVEQLLAPLSKRVCHLGTLGNGQAAKLCNQLIVAANIAAIAEALELGRTQGLDITALPGILKGGWADSLPLQIIGPRMATGVTEPAIVSIATYVKDLQLVLESAAGQGSLTQAAAQVFGSATTAGFGSADVASLRQLAPLWQK